MGVFGLLGSIAGFVRVRYLADKANIDNVIFRLHYRFTSAVFFGACVLITAFDLIGNPIDCLSDDSISRPEVLNTYCWISSTFTIPGYHGKIQGKEVAHPGVGAGGPEDEQRFHSYYQWVPFVLFLQGILFYMPHWIWKQYECGKIRALTDGSRGPNFCNAEHRHKRRFEFATYLQDTLNTHGGLALSYIFCEILNFVNAFGNIYFINRFLNGAFLTFGSRVINFSDMDQEERSDPIIEVFPRMTKCTFHKFGSSGTVQKHDALCVLALNILNEKIYIFLWFWLIILSVLSGLMLIYRLCILLSPLLRAQIFQRRCRISTGTVDTLIRRLQYGDFFILNLIGKNLEGFLFTEVADELAQRLTGNVDSKTNSLSKDSNLEMAPILTKYGGFDR